ncbi:hypothetical protein RvY_02902 [Ramazzottius varieornatus]|uniref:Uncharacterized protein n=1 Tax=Ramazzottius varieornatus TaxID=947166 RepID=A0A1D1ULA0_RAMVA|nr:hypothetical protein RvY_02902 [Ramazzottius varieornatus]
MHGFLRRSGEISAGEAVVELIDLTGQASKKRSSESGRPAKKAKAAKALDLGGLTVAEVQRGLTE